METEKILKRTVGSSQSWTWWYCRVCDETQHLYYHQMNTVVFRCVDSINHNVRGFWEEGGWCIGRRMVQRLQCAGCYCQKTRYQMHKILAVKLATYVRCQRAKRPVLKAERTQPSTSISSDVTRVQSCWRHSIASLLLAAHYYTSKRQLMLPPQASYAFLSLGMLLVS